MDGNEGGIKDWVASGEGKRVRGKRGQNYFPLAKGTVIVLRPRKGSISRIVQSLLVSHTQRYHRFHRSSGHVWQGRFKSPVIQDDEHLLTVLRYIEANPLRANLVEKAGDYRWSSFAGHGDGSPDPLLDPAPAYEALGARPATRQRRWNAYVHATPDADELAAIRRSSETGCPAARPGGLRVWRGV